MNYLEFQITTNDAIESDIITAVLGDIGFESFTENENHLLAYIQEPESKNIEDLYLEVKTTLDNVNITNEISFKIIAQQNWNATWEQSFEPILVADKCIIRAPFHSEQNEVLNIVIEPKMSFGTGHHQTTYLMLETIFEIEIANKLILDMGCGTAVLAILAEKLYAKKIVAIDIEEWAYENAIENVALNNCNIIEVLKGGAEQIGNQKFEIIIANINKNVLMNDIEIYSNALEQKGKLLLSGFFTTDAESLINKAKSHNLKHIKTKSKQEWAMLIFEKH